MDQTVFIVLHDSDYRKEYVLNVAEISSVTGSKQTSRYDGATVSMRNGDKFHCYEGTDEVQKLMMTAMRKGEE